MMLTPDWLPCEGNQSAHRNTTAILPKAQTYTHGMSHLLSAQLSKPVFKTLFCVSADSHLINESEVSDERLVGFFLGLHHFISRIWLLRVQVTKYISYQPQVNDIL